MYLCIHLFIYLLCIKHNLYEYYFYSYMNANHGMLSIHHTLTTMDFFLRRRGLRSGPGCGHRQHHPGGAGDAAELHRRLIQQGEIHGSHFFGQHMVI